MPPEYKCYPAGEFAPVGAVRRLVWHDIMNRSNAAHALSRLRLSLMALPPGGPQATPGSRPDPARMPAPRA